MTSHGPYRHSCTEALMLIPLPVCNNTCNVSGGRRVEERERVVKVRRRKW